MQNVNVCLVGKFLFTTEYSNCFKCFMFVLKWIIIRENALNYISCTLCKVRVEIFLKEEQKQVFVGGKIVYVINWQERLHFMHKLHLFKFFMALPSMAVLLSLVKSFSSHKFFSSQQLFHFTALPIQKMHTANVNCKWWKQKHLFIFFNDDDDALESLISFFPILSLIILFTRLSRSGKWNEKSHTGGRSRESFIWQSRKLYSSIKNRKVFLFARFR